MTAELIVAVLALVIALGAGALALLAVLAAGATHRDHEAFKVGVRGMAGTADKNFADDRSRIFALERFIVTVFKLDEMFGLKQPQATDVSGELTPPKKKSDLN